ncbi:MAG TPA: hypothetical protein VHB99_09395, partial [Pirellulales bacterium]|nr:hypothetical protein [Pirellulales bacterium]
MAESFDPYYKWLAIPPAEQPANHYRLLGLALFEADPDTISIAADRQMTHLRTFQTGPHSAVSQKLLNELAAARLCLLDRQQKTAYDTELKAQLGMGDPIAGPALVTNVSRRVRREHSRPRWIIPAVAAGGVLALLLCIWGVVQL